MLDGLRNVFLYALEHPTEANISIEKWNAEIERITVQQLREEILNHVDLKQVRHGRWITTSDVLDTLICSYCGKMFDMWKYEASEMFYCPHCGARMIDE